MRTVGRNFSPAAAAAWASLGWSSRRTPTSVLSTSTSAAVDPFGRLPGRSLATVSFRRPDFPLAGSFRVSTR